MPAIVVEKPKLSRPMWNALKSHIIRERQRKKQGVFTLVTLLYVYYYNLYILWVIEQEADAEVERQRREREDQQKEQEMTLEETKEQVVVCCIFSLKSLLRIHLFTWGLSSPLFSDFSSPFHAVTTGYITGV